jgi:hypothetical protein
MVLAELGGKITRALQTMAASSIIDDEVINKLTSTLAMALLGADVDIKLVKQMQNNIKAACAIEDTAAGTNKRKMIQHVSTRPPRPRDTRVRICLPVVRGGTICAVQAFEVCLLTFACPCSPCHRRS